MGSVYAGLFAEAGHEVQAVDIWVEHVDAINRDGLRVEGASGDRVVDGIRATTDGGSVGECDLYILATKAAGVGAAAETIAPLMGPESILLIIQNGLGAGERISQYMDTSHVLLGVADTDQVHRAVIHVTGAFHRRTESVGDTEEHVRGIHVLRDAFTGAEAVLYGQQD